MLTLNSISIEKLKRFQLVNRGLVNVFGRQRAGFHRQVHVQPFELKFF